MPNFIKIRPVGAELFHVDWQTDKHDEVNRRFSQFCERVHEHVTTKNRSWLRHLSRRSTSLEAAHFGNLVFVPPCALDCHSATALNRRVA